MNFHQYPLLEKLDLVLNMLATTKKMDLSFEDLEELLGVDNSPIIKDEKSFDDLYSALDKLITDSYAKSEEGMRGYTSKETGKPVRHKFTIYSITFDGRIFLEQGGYSGANSERSRVSILESRQRKLIVATFWLTLVIAFSTLIAAIYYFLEIRRVIGNHQ